MGNEYRAKVFKSGNSLALRLPKALGLNEGDELRVVREDPGSFRLEPVQVQKRKFDVDSIWGVAPELQPIRPEDRVFDPSPRPWDDPDWPGFAANSNP